MPSFDTHIEVITPDDGRGETRYFLMICVGVLVLACTLLFFGYYHHDEHKAVLPNRLNNFAIQMSNFTEEMQMMQEAHMLAEPADLNRLDFPVYHPITSTHNAHRSVFTQVADNCFVLHEGEYLFAIEKHENTWISSWAKSDFALDCHALLPWQSLNL